ncbi:DUF2334 domain-containing protein [Mariniflexile sp. AS56]|uniref:DUF2334 domain-containing protein n=1 Tax=Mariniflexile sp. AS56 TaxID=3063957 RepID=UPI0026F25854|nr:DUF2334 domain-containing protein [Mariniflexile sp. AS56]MDO7171381.1 DUF2334 domain-containing protein [Mariniflexile sp. AS56]
MSTLRYPTKIILLLILSLLTNSSCSEKTNTASIKMVFRFDDYSAKSNTDLELKIIDAFRKNKVPFTIATIPFVIAGDEHSFAPQNGLPLTQEKANILKHAMNEGVVDIALHGYTHQVHVNDNNEFADLSYNIQKEKLVKGKKLLEDLIDEPIHTFVPPWNSYDINTLKAMETVGFSTLSADRGRIGNSNSNLNFLPFTCELPNIWNAITEARNEVKNNKKSKPTIVVMFHEYDFKSVKNTGNITISELNDLLKSLKTQEDISLFSIGGIIQKFNDFTPNQYIITNRIYFLNQYLPSFLRHEVHITHYSDITHYPTLLKAIGFYFIIITVIAILFYYIGMLIFRYSELFLKIVLLLSSISTAILFYRVFYNFKFGRMGLLICVTALGATIGLIISFIKLKLKRNFK